jgi:methyl-accepting chemotaxis protein
LLGGQYNTTAEQSAESSEGILNSVDETTIATQEVASSARRRAQLSEELNSLVRRFKI